MKLTIQQFVKEREGDLRKFEQAWEKDWIRKGGKKSDLLSQEEWERLFQHWLQFQEILS